VTQQNAALVEEAAAAAESLQEQAQSLAEAVAIFKLSQSAPAASWDGKAERRGPERPTNVARIPSKAPEHKVPGHKAPAHKPAVKAPEHRPAAAAAPAPKRAAKAAAGGGAEDEWKEF